jgi:hypothetical protein
MKKMKKTLLIFLLILTLNSYGHTTIGKSVTNPSATIALRASTKIIHCDAEDPDASLPKDSIAAGETLTPIAGNYSSVLTSFKSSFALTETRTPIATMTADLDLIIADLKKYFVIGTDEYNSIGHEHYGSYIGNVGQGVAIPNAVISDLHLYPGAYFQAGAIGYAASANIIIDGLSDPNAKFIFSCSAAINFGANTKVTLINGAKACNVFWFGQGAAAAIGIGANADMVGTCIAEGAASALAVGIGANLNGRIITQNGAMNFGPGNLAVPTGTSFINFRSLISFLAFTGAGATDNVSGSSDSIPPVIITTLTGDVFCPGAYTNFGFTAPYGGLTALDITFPIVALPVIQLSGHLYQFNGPSLCSLPTFTPVAAICSGATLAPLPTSSTDTTPITGTWSPALSNTATTTYTFTPDVATTPCASTVTMTITVTSNGTPIFTQVDPIGYGATLAALPTSSTNTTPITGTWSPALNNLATTIYTFTPTAGICATTTTMTITVGPSTTWDGTAWSNGEPTSTTGIIISGNYTPLVNVSAFSLTVKDNAVVTIPTGTNITLTSKLTVEAGSSFTLSQNSNLIQTEDVVNTGAINVKRDTNELSRLDYTLWSSPVANQNLLAFSPLTSLSPTIRFYNYDDITTHAYVSVASPSTTNFAIGIGYLIRMPNTAPTYPTSTLVTGVFTGTPNNGNVGLTGLTSARFYAVGNPYPSTINVNSFLDGNATDGTIYLWRKTNDLNGLGTAYATYTKIGSTVTATSDTPNETIAVGQGFIVKTGPSATTLNFTNAMRTTINNANLFKTKAIENNRVWLNLTNKKGAFSQALVAYLTDATQGIDAGIDGKYINDSPVALTSIIDNTEFTIQGRALPFDPADIVPMNFKTDVDDDYTIAIDHFDGLFSAAQDIYLLDATNGVETDLKAGAYNFTAVAGSTNTRFSLKYQKTLKVDANTFDENSVTVYKNKGIMFVHSAKSTINNIKVFDIQGRLIAEQKNVKATSATIKDLNIGQKVLFVQITSEENQVVNKKVVN